MIHNTLILVCLPVCLFGKPCCLAMWYIGISFASLSTGSMCVRVCVNTFVSCERVHPCTRVSFPLQSCLQSVCAPACLRSFQVCLSQWPPQRSAVRKCHWLHCSAFHSACTLGVGGTKDRPGHGFQGDGNCGALLPELKMESGMFWMPCVLLISLGIGRR